MPPAGLRTAEDVASDVGSLPKKRARKILERLKTMQKEKQNWLPIFQLCSEYVMSRKQGFTGEINIQPGQIQTEHIFDDTGPNANSLMASSIIGACWPSGAKSFIVRMPFDMEDELGGEPDEVRKYYEWVTKRMARFMDNPKAGFMTALEEYMLDQGGFGISGIMVEDNMDDDTVPLSYRAVDAKSLYIAEGKNGFINTVYLIREYTIRQLVEEYGFENISKQYQKGFMAGDVETKVKVLHAIEPRLDGDPYGFGNKQMPIASIHIEINTEKILRESGFYEMPIAITRFWKAMNEVYGRCPAMQALPSILEANALGEAWVLAVEKTLDPSLLVLDDGAMGSGAIDTSPGGITVVSVSGRVTSSTVPIQPLFLVGDLSWTAKRRTELVEIIKNNFFIDRMMDLNNEQRMTLGEANIRNGLRGQTLNTTYSRQYAELFVPTLETTFNKLRRRGLLGIPRWEEMPAGSKIQEDAYQQEQDLMAKGIAPKYIPTPIVQRMIEGREIYEIEFISPATRIMQAEELQGIEHLIATTTQVAAVNPGVLDIVDWDWTLRRMAELDGSPSETIVSLERLKVMRDQRAMAQEAAQKSAMARQDSETARNVGQAAASVQGAQQAAA